MIGWVCTSRFTYHLKPLISSCLVLISYTISYRVLFHFNALVYSIGYSISSGVLHCALRALNNGRWLEILCLGYGLGGTDQDRFIESQSGLLQFVR
jgi:hypothetical protein